MEKKLNIFNTEFGIRANLKTKELKIQSYWEKINLEQQLKQNKKRKFSLHLGPPYANGDIHIGHALNFILKDLAVRFHNLKGYQTKSLPGWDTHGLPIALVVSKKEKTNDLVAFRHACAQFAKEQVKTQIQQLKRLGLGINLDNYYLTLNKKYISQELKIFAKIVSKNLIFSSLRPIYWSWSSQTALAETEVEYLPKNSTAIFVLCKIVKSSKHFLLNTNFLVWTTTVWTIPENKLLAIQKNGTYVLLQINGNKQKLIIAQKLLKQLTKELNWKKVEILKTFLGHDLINNVYQHPYLSYQARVIHSDHVNFTEGTGIVHVAPAFGIEDYQLAIKNKINFVCSIDKNGYFNQFSSDPELKQIFYQTSEKIILQKLEKAKTLLVQKPFQHQYPHDWRTKKPIIYRTTKQWYLNLQPLKKKINEIIEKTVWIPQWGKKRMKLTLAKRKDWCLSRQRVWGVPIPIFFNQKEEAVLEPTIINHVADLINQHGDNIWWTWPITKLLTKSQIQKYQIVEKLHDTFDVWFDSGCSSAIVESKDKINVVWEGNDQYRGWFNSSIIINAILDNDLGSAKILTHGFVNDQWGKKMSKSLGNVIDPRDVCQNLGADVLRLWVASSNYFEDLSLGDNLLNAVAKNYTKIRNTLRFLINNLVDFDFQKNFCQKLTEIDQWTLIKLNALIKKANLYFGQYSYHFFCTAMINFLTIELSNLYFDYAKNTLYSQAPNSSSRRQIQTTLFLCLKPLLILLAPVLSHTSEEAYQVANLKDKKTSIHLESWPKTIDLKMDEETKLMLMVKWKFIYDLKLDINKILEKAVKSKQIKRFNEVEIFVSYNQDYQLFSNQEDYQKFLTQWEIKSKNNWEKVGQNWKKNSVNIENTDNLAQFLQVQQITFTKKQDGTKFKTGWIKFQKKQGRLCQRCSLVFSTNKNQLICSPCQEIMSQI